jgi:uncharacterized protein YlxP (DUF503 family)
MLVAIALFEIHIPHAQSLKEKRMVVKGLRDRLRNRFEISAAEVGMQDLHQRARLAVTFIALDRAGVDGMLERIQSLVESGSDGIMTGWTREVLDFDENAALGTAGLEFE